MSSNTFRRTCARVSREAERPKSCASGNLLYARDHQDAQLKTPDGPVQRQITYRDWHIVGAVGEISEVQVVVNDSGSIIFGRCSCPFFDANLMQQGPCEHILALYQASAQNRVDRPTSVSVAKEQAVPHNGEERVE